MGCDCHSEELNDIVKEYRAASGNGCKLFEDPELYSIFGGTIRPGGLSVTRRAMELCDFKKGAKILDVGCGYGATVELLHSDYGAEAVGIDLSTDLLEKGKSRNPELNLIFGDGEMLNFSSLTFDGIFIECALSLMDNITEALHEAYCVLKKGGKLIISDFYLKEPGVSEGKSCRGNCSGHCSGQDHGEHSHEGGNPVKTEKVRNCLEGAFIPEDLKGLLEEIGFKILIWEDKNNELKDFTAALIMHYGSIEAFFKSTAEKEEDSPLSGIQNHNKVGYFLLIAEKS
ncbi:MAG TPA: methyltransferase domain-containing protein [Bacillota bacterium]|jgi:SAM-dependent methyltransferase|nr:methyltransferase domain-containing protein [Bacillota bacterium]